MAGVVAEFLVGVVADHDHQIVGRYDLTDVGGTGRVHGQAVAACGRDGTAMDPWVRVRAG
jgi:hypothetical protein